MELKDLSFPLRYTLVPKLLLILNGIESYGDYVGNVNIKE